ncbi:MAG: T9SS type A sorting domain-containing protein, partial [bacterium]
NVGGTVTVTGVTGNINDHPKVIWSPNYIYPTSAGAGEPTFTIEFVVQRKRTSDSTFQDIATVDTTAYTDLNEIITNQGSQPTTYYRIRTKTTYVAGIVLSVPSNKMGVTSEAYKIAINETIPKRTQLFGNYPNPFNPSTTITFDLSKAGFVSLKIYDILGREVSTLLNENSKAGRYSRVFDASQLSSGVYFYRLQAESFTQTRKLLFTK